ncbi:MAG: hypothetical protein J6B34_05955 [Clostridia bacterium]|nr:hypothetical protein [Clostridia bacterium]
MEENEKSTGKIIGTVIKFTLALAVFAFIFALVFRMCQADYKALEGTEITESFKSAYAVSDDVRTHAINDNFSENGAVYGYSLTYIEEAGYLQFTVRYNVRHIDEVILSYPEFKEESIRYELVDKNGKTYAPNIIGEETKYNYHYFKLEFTNVDFSTENLSVKMILDGIDINVGDKSTLVVHRSDDTSIPFILSDEQMSLINK